MYSQCVHTSTLQCLERFVFLFADDDNRTMGVVKYVSANTAQEGSAYGTVASRSYNNEVRALFLSSSCNRLSGFTLLGNVTTRYLQNII